MTEPFEPEPEFERPAASRAESAEADPDTNLPQASTGAEEPLYRLADPDPAPAAAVAATTLPAEPPMQAASGSDEAVRAAEETRTELPTVDQVWSRWMEWREPIVWASVSIALAVFVHVAGGWTMAVILFVGLGYAAYRVAITLEVPVRVTSEQAVTEFYAALGHRFPNYRRMYSLLTAEAKRSTRFAGFAGFKAYWKDQLARLAKIPQWLRPMEFRVEACTTHHNEQKTWARMRYRLTVFRQGSASSQPLAEFDVENQTVKGPDGQWYLNGGTLPD